MRQKLSKDLINELCDNCRGDQYCIMKELLNISALIDPRLLLQIKCVEIFKYERGVDTKEEIDWQTALALWVSEGLAKAFEIVYADIDHDIDHAHPRAIYNSVRKIARANATG